MGNILGNQTILELYGCDEDLLNDIDYIKKSMIQAAKEANATMVQQYFHQFSPHGVSGTIVIVESHINIHTWPEHQYAAIDIFSCSDQMKISKACESLITSLRATKHMRSNHERGHLETIKKVHDLQIRNRRQ